MLCIVTITQIILYEGHKTNGALLTIYANPQIHPDRLIPTISAGRWIQRVFFLVSFSVVARKADSKAVGGGWRSGPPGLEVGGKR
jgi:hypothetical protein